MIEEVVNSILEAEDVAQKKIDAAKLTAGEIVATAEAQADNLKKQTSAQNKQTLVEGIRNVERQSIKNSDDVLRDLNAESDKELAKYEKNVDKAVKIILEYLK